METRNTLSKKIIWIVGIIVVCAATWQFVLSSPATFNDGDSIVIDPGETISQMGNELATNHIIRSATTFHILMKLLGRGKSVNAGMYVFNEPENVFDVAYRVSHSDFGYTPVKLTVPEGLTSMEISTIIHDKFSDIDEVAAENILKPYEGELFPETYFFPPQVPVQMIADRMTQEFDTNMGSIQSDISLSTHSLSDILKVASILEKEVQSDTDRKMVADLIWRRIKLGMPLQADSSLSYITGKPSLELTSKDLQIDSPYNLYRYAGLPPTPISNPGLEAIEAALHPTPNKYLYFLSDKNGITHFATTYSEHVKNRKKYLGK